MDIGSNVTPAPKMKSPTLLRKSHRKIIISYIILTFLSLPLFFMYLWLFLSSISSEMVAGIIPKQITFENWRFLWENVEVGSRQLPSIWLATWNTLLLAGGLTIIEVIISVMAGYALSRMEFPGRTFFLRSVILLHAFPSVALLIAVFYVLDTLGLIDTLWGVMLVKAALQIPMSTYIIKGFFDDVPWDVEWSALIDGCNRIKAWYQVVIPLVKPGIAAISIFSFLAGWSEFLLLYTFIFDDQNITLATYLQKIIGDFQMVDYGLLTAAGLFYMLPVIFFFIFTQKSLMQMNMGGNKRV
ncbi:carbohydrate ABC transporter permease [Fervidibacillus halotolerans]|uniref:Carbohydrate ABC transporter permease n=1 Tax=Fervidibacillus halotolerans TaxID=2980027 RepID=A0A9E8M1P9_9BACI|nr:carbohydrate ABC transporter permease [Fervidibacillus halotolerans]WAA13782.1 carbohydrate ABC transporter permease [Fervidibacillus halotolerans]